MGICSWTENGSEKIIMRRVPVADTPEGHNNSRRNYEESRKIRKKSWQEQQVFESITDNDEPQPAQGEADGGE